MDFDTWLNELNTEAAKRGYAGADQLWQGTGADCWRPYFEGGHTPASALSEDESYGYAA